MNRPQADLKEHPLVRTLYKIPTYNHGVKEHYETKPEFEYESPPASMVVSESDGVAVMLHRPGHALEDTNTPSVMIERRPHGWAVFLNDSRGTVAVAFILDDDRIVVQPDAANSPIEMYTGIEPFRGADVLRGI